MLVFLARLSWEDTRPITVSTSSHRFVAKVPFALLFLLPGAKLSLEATGCAIPGQMTYVIFMDKGWTTTMKHNKWTPSRYDLPQPCLWECRQAHLPLTESAHSGWSQFHLYWISLSFVSDLIQGSGGRRMWTTPRDCSLIIKRTYVCWKCWCRKLQNLVW